ncbi:hypothetical protein K1719_026369 [Acacia pycnantha]|nr:hypothetical protein K1719_026369 [Acacia pycnantha]
MPMEHYTVIYIKRSTAILIGDIVGDFVQFEEENEALQNVRFLRVCVSIDPALPLNMGCYVQFEKDSRHEWVQFKYERVFRLCCAFGRIGHVDQDFHRRHRRRTTFISWVSSPNGGHSAEVHQSRTSQTAPFYQSTPARFNIQSSTFSSSTDSSASCHSELQGSVLHDFSKDFQRMEVA